MLKRNAKVIVSSKGYSTVVTKSFQDNISYYTYKDGQMNKLDRSRNKILATMSDKKDAIDNYLKLKSVNFKKDEGLSNLFTYYNSLQ